MNYQCFREGAERFLNTIWSEIQSKEIPFQESWDIDHLCYRVETEGAYQDKKSAFSQFGDLLGESVVNGRLISTYKLHLPISFKMFQIDLIELPSPKKGASYREGFEHIEVVVDEDFCELEKKLKDHKIKKSGLEKLINQELAVCLTGGVIKFHQLSLESLMTLERNTELWGVLQNSGILSNYSDYSPLVAGTFPLGISNSKSDLDILLCCKNLDLMSLKLQSDFGEFEAFTQTRSIENGLDSLTTSLKIKSIDIEIFSQFRASVQQRAYRHFQVEERLLKYGGKKLRDRITVLRGEGLKTEPAFSKALGLKGDSFDQLEQLHSWPISKIAALLKEL